MLAVVFALSAVVVAPASAKLTKHQKAHVRKQLKRAIKKNPKLIRSKHFIKKASLVNFKLPVTIQLRGSSSATANPNSANIDLGPSLGQRSISLGGKLKAEIQFADSFDGGALGNVNLKILPSTTAALTSTSIPLLWNTQVSQGDYAASLLGAGTVGCGNFTGTTALPFGPFPAVPYYADLTAYASATPPGSVPTGFVPEIPGPDSIDKLAANTATSPASANDDVNNHLGGNATPFPSGSTPGGFTQPPSVTDTVLRTGALTLTVPPAGTPTTPSSVSGSQDNEIGQSGGQANLFGDIPGKSYGIDVTVNLGTRINSIIREVDADASRPLLSGLPYTSGAFTCRQAWTGQTQNYITGVRLKGDLSISPAITPTGKLRIAKATLQSLQPDTIGLAACLAPNSVFAPALNNSDTATVPVPSAAGAQPDTVLPINDTSAVGRPAPTVDCNTNTTKLVQDAGFTGLPAITDPAFSVTNDGSSVSVAGDLSVTNVSADVLIGDV
jgi:hypothetical protein